MLLLGEIDLSIGYVTGIGGTIVADWSAPLTAGRGGRRSRLGLLACAGDRAAPGARSSRGSACRRSSSPSPACSVWEGVILLILGNGGTIPINDTVIIDIASANLSNTAGWIVMLVIVGLFGLAVWRRDAKRRGAGLVAPPPNVTLLKIAGALLAGVGLVLLCNTDRGIFAPVSGVPYVVLLVLAVVGVATFVLGRTKLGRYLYAIGGSAEAARRAGVNLATIRTTAFMLCSFTAGIAGIVYASRLRSISTSINGGTLVLYAIAAAVIGGTSLFGGRGKAMHGVLGGIVIAAIDNGMGLVGFSAPAQYMVTALVLLAAVTIDAQAHRGRVGNT